uniref:Uncharacterized protein n=1 Tax=Picea glauca TaxID=3330 RepID=A0A117NGY1_PICGL|nr:hypothetical protein ABT39_MTgene5696 [Picea glauca]
MKSLGSSNGEPGERMPDSVEQRVMFPPLQ